MPIYSLLVILHSFLLIDCSKLPHKDMTYFTTERSFYFIHCPCTDIESFLKCIYFYSVDSFHIKMNVRFRT